MQANPKIQALAVLIGEWTTVGAHPMVPGQTFHGRATFTRLESGAFLLVHMHVDEPEIPDGVAILGTDDATPTPALCCTSMSETSHVNTAGRSPATCGRGRATSRFSQRMVLTIAKDGQSIEAKGQMARNGQAWEPDLQLTYSRVS